MLCVLQIGIRRSRIQKNRFMKPVTVIPWDYPVCQALHRPSKDSHLVVFNQEMYVAILDFKQQFLNKNNRPTISIEDHSVATAWILDEEYDEALALKKREKLLKNRKRLISQMANETIVCWVWARHDVAKQFVLFFDEKDVAYLDPAKIIEPRILFVEPIKKDGSMSIKFNPLDEFGIMYYQ